MLVLCGDEGLRDSLVDLLADEGRPTTIEPLHGQARLSLAIASCDTWPAGWSLTRLRSVAGGLPCVVLSGSPLGGDFLVSGLPLGYYVQLPTLPETLLELLAEVSGD